MKPNEPDEEWRIVPSVPVLMASSLGRIMVIEHLAAAGRGGLRRYGGRPSYGQWSQGRYSYRGGNGYARKTRLVSRLVCEAFHGAAPKDSPICMHLNEDASDNRPENLAWGTQKLNLNFPGYIEKMRARQLGNKYRSNHAKRKREQVD